MVVPFGDQCSSQFFAAFIEENMRRVFRLVYRVVGNVPDAQDVTQEAFVKALTRRDQLKDPEKTAHWLGRIAVNTALDFVRRRKRVVLEDLEQVVRDLMKKTTPTTQADLF